MRLAQCLSAAPHESSLSRHGRNGVGSGQKTDSSRPKMLAGHQCPPAPPARLSLCFLKLLRAAQLIFNEYCYDFRMLFEWKKATFGPNAHW